MLQSYFTKFIEKKVWLAIVLPLWVLGSFVLAQAIIGGVSRGLLSLGVPLREANETVLSTVLGGLIYVVTIALVVGLPWLVKKYRTSKEEIGLTRLPSWMDILLAPAGFLVYLVLSGLLLYAASNLLTFIDFNQAQNTGYDQISQQFEYVLAFLMLVLIAPFAEEILFRGYLFGKLRKHVPLWVAIVITSLLFGLVHGAWNVGIDVFALSIVLCLLRVWSKSLWPSILVHMIKNGIAFYLLFINPYLLTSLG